MIKLIRATGNDQVKNVFLFYGIEVDKSISLPKEYDDMYMFEMNDKKYFGGNFDVFSEISNILAYTFDEKWFIATIKGAAQELGIDDKLKITDDTQCVLFFATLEKNQNKETKENNETIKNPEIILDFNFNDIKSK